VGRLGVVVLEIAKLGQGLLRSPPHGSSPGYEGPQYSVAEWISVRDAVRFQSDSCRLVVVKCWGVQCRVGSSAEWHSIDSPTTQIPWWTVQWLVAVRC